MQQLWNTVLRFLKKLNRELSQNPNTTLLGIYSKELQVYVYTKTGTQTLIAVVLKIATGHQLMNGYMKQSKQYIHVQWNIQPQERTGTALKEARHKSLKMSDPLNCNAKAVMSGEIKYLSVARS